MSASSNRTQDFSTAGWPILSQEELRKVSQNKEFDENAEVFYSSGDEPKELAFSPEDLDELAEGFGLTFQEIGMVLDDKALNLGGEGGHMSSWCFTHGPEWIGAETINRSKQDFEEYQDRWDEVTTIMSLPKPVKSLGKMIEAEYGDLGEVFPEARLSITAGESMADDLREEIREMYGFDIVNNFYAGTEPGAVGAEVEPGVYKQTNPHLKIEILEEGAEVDDRGRAPEDKIHSLDELDEPVEGSILFTSIRDELPLIRYRAGDLVRGRPDGLFKFICREDKVANVSGAMVYPNETKKASDYIGASDYREVFSEEDGIPVWNWFVKDDADTDVDPVEVISRYNESIHTWYDPDTMNIRLEEYSSEEELEQKLERYDLDEQLVGNKMKEKKRAFDSSWSS